MPFVLAALALRALIPAGFMPGSVDGIAFTAMLCAPLTPGATERIELPAPNAQAQAHCDFCVSPLLGALPAAQGARLPVGAIWFAPRSLLAQISSHAPDRAPSARAPPA
jgi:hypothetical protein